ncbi:unnamed protein product [Linum tenue]|uniref:Uncharacterized protein n=1 Tax=Linum tenue TaxID=586396 RepID=A0AAV0L1Y1_9ROSI|nr:unnamed protein product [Linum tenue]
MASSLSHHRPLQILAALLTIIISLTSHISAADVPFEYHNGDLLSGNITVNVVWYGLFKPTQKVIVMEFLASLDADMASDNPPPSVLNWWNLLDKYYSNLKSKNGLTLPIISLSPKMINDEDYSLGKSLTQNQLVELSKKGNVEEDGAVLPVVITANDVVVDGFCRSKINGKSSSSRSVYVWVGNSETQCPGLCEWPFHQAANGPPSPVLVAPNGDAAMDGVVINLASLLAGAVTNPFGDGYFQGPKEAPLEAGSACPGVFGKGSHPGFAGDLLKDDKSGASYNANGIKGRKFLVPGLFDPATSTCSTVG